MGIEMKYQEFYFVQLDKRKQIPSGYIKINAPDRLCAVRYLLDTISMGTKMYLLCPSEEMAIEISDNKVDEITITLPDNELASKSY
jgi:hypothetical protein